MNNDVVFEILLHLPVRSLLRFIGVCKLWCNTIDSPHFKKLHSLRRTNNEDEEVYLRFNFDFDYGQIRINIRDNGKSLKSHHFLPMDIRVSGAVKGLVCFSSPRGMLDIAICNPFLGQFKYLPLSPYFSTHGSHGQLFHGYNVGLGFDDDYKVVQLLPCSCLEHRNLHAYLYSARTNSWSELCLDQDLVIENPVRSLCKDGSFAHWEGRNTSGEKIILSFDMKKEVFGTITIPDGQVFDHTFDFFGILAKGECSFVIFFLDTFVLKVYEWSGEGGKLIWNNVDNVVLKNGKSNQVIWYDSRARKFIRLFKMYGSSILKHDLIEYEGSLISP
ncbi:putative F-box protein [Salvia divinorum]|uniref:F-box protein n=1 Tax=Salvia divinorum TaxID=28513 RepID=A0ABD1FXC3_SALDI